MNGTTVLIDSIYASAIVASSISIASIIIYLICKMNIKTPEEIVSKILVKENVSAEEIDYLNLLLKIAMSGEEYCIRLVDYYSKLMSESKQKTNSKEINYFCC